MGRKSLQIWDCRNRKMQIIKSHTSKKWFRQHKFVSTNYLAWYFNVTDIKATITTCCKMSLTKRIMIFILQPFIASPHTGMVQSESYLCILSKEKWDTPKAKNSYKHKRPSTRKPTSNQHLSFLAFLSLASSSFHILSNCNLTIPTFPCCQQKCPTSSSLR